MLIGRRGSSGRASRPPPPEPKRRRAVEPRPRRRAYEQPPRSRGDATRSAALGALIVLAGIGAYLAAADPSEAPRGDIITLDDIVTTGRPAPDGEAEDADASADAAPPDPSGEVFGGNGETEPVGGVRDVSGIGITRLPLAGTDLVRLPSAVEVPPPPPPGPPAPDLYRLVVFLDADRIDARGRIIQLEHIEAPDAAARCTNAAGAEWPCGMRAQTAVRRLVQRRIIACDPFGLAEAEAQRVVTTRCSVADTDIGRWLVEQGWARPVEEGEPPEDLVALHRQARAEQRGLYAPDAR